MNVSAILATILHPTAMPNLAAGEAARPNIILIMVD
jgi:hypothetical protein